jgi:hypothetical protein
VNAERHHPGDEVGHDRPPFRDGHHSILWG